MEAKSVEEKNTPCDKSDSKPECTSDINIVEVAKAISSKFVNADKKIEEISSICSKRIARGR